MPFQVTTDTPHTSLQVSGGTVIHFFEKEGKYFSQAIEKEVAYALAEITGFVAKEITGAEAKAADTALAEAAKIQASA